MGDVERNREVWESEWDWSNQGDEWSAWWGGTVAMWHGALLPRLHAFLPAETILEIAPGFGRWTQFLKGYCDRMLLVDLTQRCIDACRDRFADATHISYFVNDGRSLEMIEDGTVDLAFSFDSLVHAEMDVLEAYIAQLRHKLTLNGVAFIHHSNMGHHPLIGKVGPRIPRRLLRAGVTRGIFPDLFAWRSPSVTDASVRTASERAGLSCISQERFSWENGAYVTDTVTLLTPNGSRWNRPLRKSTNRQFRNEARRIRELYAASGFPHRGQDGA